MMKQLAQGPRWRTAGLGFGLRSVWLQYSQMELVIKNLPGNAEGIRDESSIPGLGRFLEKEMATHSSILAWRIPWTKEPGGLQSRGLQSQTRLSTYAMYHMHKENPNVTAL